MKVIINIPEEVTEDIKTNYKGDDVLYVAVKYGTPIPDNATVCDIDAIRQEIDQIPCAVLNRYTVLEIIDKHMEGATDDNS